MKGTELSLSRETTLLLQDLALSTIQIHTLKVQAMQMHVQFYWICKFRNLAAHICRSRRCLAYFWLQTLTNIVHLVMLSAPPQLNNYDFQWEGFVKTFNQPAAGILSMWPKAIRITSSEDLFWFVEHHQYHAIVIQQHCSFVRIAKCASQ